MPDSLPRQLSKCHWSSPWCPLKCSDNTDVSRKLKFPEIDALWLPLHLQKQYMQANSRPTSNRNNVRVCPNVVIDQPAGLVVTFDFTGLSAFARVPISILNQPSGPLGQNSDWFSSGVLTCISVGRILKKCLILTHVGIKHLSL